MAKFQGTNLYVKHLEEEIDEERFMKEFSAFGTIHSAKIMTDTNGNSRGFGFVSYNTPEEAQRAISETNGRILQSCQKPLYVALHEPKEIRRQKLAQRYSGARGSKVIRNSPVQMYGTGQPVYYPPTNGNVPGYIFPPQQIIPPRGQWQQPFQNSYPVVMPQRGRGGGTGRGDGRRRNRGGGGGRNGLLPEKQQQIGNDLTVSQLAAYPVEHQKLLIGERLWGLIYNVQPVLAGKITGMLLESGWSMDELIALITDEDRLSKKINEAVEVLQKAQEEGSQDQLEAEHVDS